MAAQLGEATTPFALDFVPFVSALIYDMAFWPLPLIIISGSVL